MKSPVALFMFRRPDTTARVLDAIRAARPPLLLVVADGPRADRPDDTAACAATRALIDGVDWPCEVRRKFAAENMGCRRRVASGLAWVFSQVPEAIILEDDCVPDPTFFPFCDELLERYRDDPRVAQISGANNQKGRRRGTHSYFFSRYNNVWGWASWRRAFAMYDVDMGRWPELRDSGWLAGVLGDRRMVHYWTQQFQAVYDGRIDTWDYQWIYSTWLHAMVSLVPNSNLVKNIGFGPGASHTSVHDPFANDRLEAIDFPLDHPPTVTRDPRADQFTERFEFTEPMFTRLRRAVRGRVLGPLKQRLRVAFNIPVQLAFPAFTVDLPPDHLLPSMLRAYPRYDRFLPHLAKYLDQGDVVLDVGANCGDTLAAMCSANPALSFVCVEPDATFFAYLTRNARRITAAIPGTSVRLVQRLAGLRAGASVLQGDGGTRTARAVNEAEGAVARNDEVHRTARLDEIVRGQPGLAPERFRLLKSDVDGYDYDVIASAGALLDNERLLVFFECYAENDEQRAGYLGLFEALAARGYRHFSFFDNFGNFLQHVTSGDIAAVHRQLRDVWDSAPGAANAAVYLDVLACREGDAALVSRIVTEFSRA
ncbi:MAG: FkbM family methyltransferase [Gemmatimonadaceae bacterium]